MKLRRRDSGQESVAAERAELEPTSPLWGEHRSRYHLAAPFAFNRTVLDVACGSDFGSQILAEAGAAQVVAADLSPDAFDGAIVDDAIVQFVQADAMDLPLMNEVFDLVVSFKTIEHFEEGDRYAMRASVRRPDRVIATIRRLSRPGGGVSRAHRLGRPCSPNTGSSRVLHSTG